MSALLPCQADLKDPELLRRVNVLHRPNNITNWFYLAREYLFLVLVIGLTIAFYQEQAAWGLSFAWNVPVTLLAIVLIGAGQHRLTTLGHEASHYMLFRHRLLNELVSDLFCMFPVWSTTHHYRIQHLAHHQFPNDPERDPDVTQMEASGHRFHFPMNPRQFVWECVVKQALWIPSLIRYVRMRARYAATGGGTGPYEAKGPRSKVLILVGLLYLGTLAAVVSLLAHYDNRVLLTGLPPVMLAGVCTFYALVPARLYRQTNLKPDISPRWQTLLRMTYLSGLFTTLAWLSVWTSVPWGLYYVVLWLVPLATAFAFFMLMRQVVQHGNAGSDRFGNTRIFEVSRLIRFAVFPLGMDYHLPHHLFPMVPHYRLRALHTLLMQTLEYRKQACLVEGYFRHRDPPAHPTVLEIMSR